MGRFRPVLRGFGLTEQQWRIIRALSEVEEIDAGELARISFILAPSLSRILQKLDAKGLVFHRNDANDQRRTLISLTQSGHELFQRVRNPSSEAYEEIAHALGAERLEELYAILEEVESRLKALRTAA